jgi:hypothetical protein
MVFAIQTTTKVVGYYFLPLRGIKTASYKKLWEK